MLRPSIPLGRFAGVRVGLNPTVLVIAVLLVTGLAFGRLPAAFPGYGVAGYLAAAVAGTLAFLASLLAHELAHAVVARREGVEVAGVTLWLLGGVAHLRGEPRTPGADLRIAAAGPLVSLALGVCFGLLALAGQGLVRGTLTYLAGANLVLAVFNLVPGAPLDGGRILRALLWAWRGDRVFAAVVAAKAGKAVGWTLLALGGIMLLTGAGLQGVWFGVVGLFVAGAAAAEERHARAIAPQKSPTVT
ncbi:site-2 protease family protein [Nonomuraea typhae]|uniref:Site-2 protease family protein n=1 Tax=Nonomuraea typhae TaxID=2603600 RepID=A0ABW7Z5H8_9ACTN